MAEVHIQDFQQVGCILPTDILNVQRHDGEWRNYRTPAAQFLGLETVIYEEDFDFSEINPGFPAVQVLPDPGAGNVYFIINAWVRYNPDPGGVNSGDRIKMTGSWFEQSQNFSALLATSSQGSVATMYWENQSGRALDPYYIDRNFRITCGVLPGGTMPTDDGWLTLHLEYAIVAL